MRYYCCTIVGVVVVAAPATAAVDVCSTLPTPLLFVPGIVVAVVAVAAVAVAIAVVACLAQYVAMFAGCQHEIYAGFTST